MTGLKQERLHLVKATHSEPLPLLGLEGTGNGEIARPLLRWDTFWSSTFLFWLMGNVRCDDLQHYQQAVSSHQELPRIHSLDSQQSGPTVQGGGSLADCKAMGWSVPKGFAWVSYMKGKRDSIPAGVEGWLTFKHYQWLQSGLGASRFLASYSSTWNKGTQISY